MRLAWAWALLTAGCAIVVVAACVGDDPAGGGASSGGSSSGTPGELGAPCNEGRCLDQLVCIDDVCRRPDGGTGPGDDGGGTNLDAGDGGDAAPPPCVHEAGAAAPLCPGVAGSTCPAATPCCALSTLANSCQDAGDCLGLFGVPLVCNGKDNCNGEQCCLTLNSVLDASVCPTKLAPGFGSGVPATRCAAACEKDFVVCRSGAECDAGQICNRFIVDTNDGPIPLGVCN